MKKISREHEIYLEHRARVENVTDIRDYQQLVGEHACVMIDMLHAMAQRPMRVTTIAHIGARAEQNVSEWHAMMVGDGIDQRRVQGILNKATDDLIDFMQVGTPKQEKAFLDRQHKQVGAALGDFCATAGKWRKGYDDVQHQEVADRIQRRWARYVGSLVTFTRLIQRAASRHRNVPEGTLYQHGTMVLMHAQALGQAWSDWTQ